MGYLFFHLYNRLYQDGRINTRNHPEYDAIGLMFFGTFMWFLSIYCLYYFYFLNIDLPHNFHLYCIVVVALISLLLYLLFIHKNRYNKIYLKYQRRNKKQRKKGLLISILYVFLPFLISVFCTLKWHQKI
jgi:hypothetical protein